MTISGGGVFDPFPVYACVSADEQHVMSKYNVQNNNIVIVITSN